MEAQSPEIPPTPVTEIGSLVRAVEAERAGRYVEAWHEALKAIALRPFHPEAYIQMASTAVAAGDPEAGLRAARRALALTPKWTTAQQVVAALERTLNAHRKQRKKANPIAWPALPDPNRKPRLSVCMIVKNEERFLGQCLASVKDIADELIVIDTGSTDRTVEIAREHGAQVGHFEWCNDFAAARNASIAPATGDWILYLDADEELNFDFVTGLTKLLNNREVNLYRLALVNHHQGECSKSYVPRLYRNMPGIAFTGCVHEGVFTHIEKVSSFWQMCSVFGELVITHYGYEQKVMQERDKLKRNHDLLVKAIKETPNEFYFHMQLGLELGRMGKKEESFQEYDLALNLAETIGFNKITPEVRETLLTQYSAYLLKDQRYQEVVQVLSGRLATVAELSASQLMVRARALISLKCYPAALNDVKIAFKSRNSPTRFPSAVNASSLALEAIAGEVYYLNGHFHESIQFFEKALISPRVELRTILAYAECLDRIGETQKSLKFLLMQVETKKCIPEIWAHGAKILARHGSLTETFNEWIAEAEKRYPNNLQIGKIKTQYEQGVKINQ